MASIYDFSLPNVDGTQFKLNSLRGRVLLIVNTATRCGFTPQYKELELLYSACHRRGLEILDIPCNQFAGQTPESDEEISTFCDLNYHTEFLRFKKSDVNGPNALPLYQFLKEQAPFKGFAPEHPLSSKLDEILSGIDPKYAESNDVKWNFTKFLVDVRGNVVARFEPTADMEEIEAKVIEIFREGEKELFKPRVAIVGYGNVGRYVLQALENAPDLNVAGLVRRHATEDLPSELAPYMVVDDISKLRAVDVAILCVPSRLCEEYGRMMFEHEIDYVDSFDIHTEIPAYLKRIDSYGSRHGRSCIIAAGWDPGSDSIVRALMESLLPAGLTYTNFGPGMSMGHTVCVKSKPGVKNALSMTIPKGEGLHRRMVYVELEDGASLEEVTKAIKEDPYFANDETHVFDVPSVAALQDVGHGVNMVRKGVSGKTHNQRMEFNMSINNPALTGQMLVNAARAVMRFDERKCCTLIEVPVVDLLPGSAEDAVKRLV